MIQENPPKMRLATIPLANSGSQANTTTAGSATRNVPERSLRYPEHRERHGVKDKRAQQRTEIHHNNVPVTRANTGLAPQKLSQGRIMNSEM